MIDLRKITRGAVDRKPRILIYGMDGIGKTMFACASKNPFVIDANRGSFDFPVERYCPDDWSQVRELTDAVELGKIKCDTIVYDSLTDIEKMCHTQLFGPTNTTVVDYKGGYKAGDSLVTETWRSMLAQLERIWSMDKTIVLVAHTTVTNFRNPMGADYNRFVVSLREPLAAQLREWCDFVFFAREEIVPGVGKGKALTTGVRWAYSRRCPEFDAKARGSKLFPERFPLSWSDFELALKTDNADLKKSIEDMLVELGDPKITAQATEYLQRYPQQLAVTHNQITAMIEKKRTAATGEQTPAA